MRRANRGVEPPPGFETATKRDGAFARREKEAVPPDHNTAALAIRVGSQDEVQCRNEREDFIVFVLRVTA